MQRTQVVSVRLHYFLISHNIILVAIATFLDKLENKVKIHHVYIKTFHMVKRLRKSVQYIRRYSTKYASFLGHVVPDVHKWFGCHGNVPWEILKYHLHGKRFHMVKRLWKSVQYIRRYATKYAEPREHATQFPSVSLFSAETSGAIFTKI